MLEAIERIERYSEKGPDVFKRDELIQTWVVYHLQIIGEAASKLGRGFHNTHSEIPWPQIIAMRNLLTHEYFGIDLDEVWQVVERDLPTLKQRLNRISERPSPPRNHD
jgi:uncharacterized protein with HEPN domain